MFIKEAKNNLVNSLFNFINGSPKGFKKGTEFKINSYLWVWYIFVINNNVFLCDLYHKLL